MKNRVGWQNLNQTPLLQGALSVEKIFSLATWEERYEKSRSWRQIQIMNNLDPEKTFIWKYISNLQLKTHLKIEKKT